MNIYFYLLRFLKNISQNIWAYSLKGFSEAKDNGREFDPKDQIDRVLSCKLYLSRLFLLLLLLFLYFFLLFLFSNFDFSFTFEVSYPTTGSVNKEMIIPMLCKDTINKKKVSFSFSFPLSNTTQRWMITWGHLLSESNPRVE
jgi:hypothetical protein